MTRLSKKRAKAFKLAISLYTISAILLLFSSYIYVYQEMPVRAGIYGILATLLVCITFLFASSNKKHFRK